MELLATVPVLLVAVTLLYFATRYLVDQQIRSLEKEFGYEPSAEAPDDASADDTQFSRGSVGAVP